jgi:hypothetical protein
MYSAADTPGGGAEGGGGGLCITWLRRRVRDRLAATACPGEVGPGSTPSPPPGPSTPSASPPSPVDPALMLRVDLTATGARPNTSLLSLAPRDRAERWGLGGCSTPGRGRPAEPREGRRSASPDTTARPGDTAPGGASAAGALAGPLVGTLAAVALVVAPLAGPVPGLDPPGGGRGINLGTAPPPPTPAPAPAPAPALAFSARDRGLLRHTKKSPEGKGGTPPDDAASLFSSPGRPKPPPAPPLGGPGTRRRAPRRAPARGFDRMETGPTAEPAPGPSRTSSGARSASSSSSSPSMRYLMGGGGADQQQGGGND